MFDVSAVGAPLDERYPEELADAAVSALQARCPTGCRATPHRN